LKKIKLIGDISEKYKAEWLMDVTTPSEAVRAIEANRPGFIDDISDGYSIVLVDESNPDESRQIVESNKIGIWAGEVMYIIPNANGEWTAAVIIGGIVAAAIPGVVAGGLIAATITYTVAVIVIVAVMVAVSMIASLISGSPGGGGKSADQTEAPESKTSYISNGVVNTARQGHRIPVAYGGPILCGSMILSSRINVEDVII